MTRVQRFVSGIQPSGLIHLGNYFGAIRDHVRLQDQGECFYLIADYHAMTTTPEAEELRRLTRHVARIYLACGLDTERAYLYRQSDVPEVHELAWYLQTQTPSAKLELAHAVKDARAHKKGISAATFNYPLLMAADILIVEADVVPVGYDQRQHVEITRDIARRYTTQYQDTHPLTTPEIMLGEANLVLGKDREKMSKRNANALSIVADWDEIEEYCRAIKTDSRGEHEPKDPDTCTVVSLHRLVARADQAAALRQRYIAGTIGYGEAKALLAAALFEYFTDIRARYHALGDEDVEAALHRGRTRVRPIARATLDKYRAAAGLHPLE